jgi:hypothetical protein
MASFMNTILAHGEMVPFMAAGWVVGIPLGLAARFFADHFSITGGRISRWIARTLAWLTMCACAALFASLVYGIGLTRHLSHLSWYDYPLLAIASLPVVAISYGPAIILAILALRTIRKPPKIGNHPQCSNCGYNLTGNVSGICSECGTAIPAEDKTE